MMTKKVEKVAKYYECKNCDYSTSKKSDFNKLLSNDEELSNDMMTKKVAKVAKDYECKSCDYSTCKKNNFNKHLQTSKHLSNTSSYTKYKPKDYICKTCNKIYKSRHGLWNHKKKCMFKDKNIIVDQSSNEINTMTGLMIEIVKSNNEIQKQNSDLQKQNIDLQKQVLEICQKMQQPTITTNSNNTNNSHNKTFNLHFFLNEECKDAMNMSEFIESIKLKISDLENIGKVGYIEGMSNIIIEKLNDTDINKRPVHCSDLKRETIYIKEENKWEKDTEDAKKMVKAVREVNRKNYNLLANWKDTHPSCTDSSSKQSEEYTILVGEVVMDNDETNVKKVIKKVAKQIVIDK